ncbi:MAG: alginate O-acetyltransferase complex protein AlgI [Psychroserpens sp.]
MKWPLTFLGPMLFNSIEFAVFLPLVFCIYWLVLGKSIKLQNLFLLFASYVFYGWWDPRFLVLIILSTIVDFYIGIGLNKSSSPKTRKSLIITSIVVNIGILFVFKYYGFFVENFIDAFTFFGSQLSLGSLNIILPVGISFYTFQTLSYSIDVYRRKLEPTTNFISFAAFVSFFPQLVAGPIERATNLLPQFYKGRIFNYAQSVDGLRQILWGLLKKVVIADNCAEYVNVVFESYQSYEASSLVIAAFFFSIQIYCDFSGYSDIAIGTAKLFGFNLMRNFAYPYFSRDISEFWRRWHISLSTWFRDYLYIPLGGSRGGLNKKIRNTLIIFVVSGFWHGANWTFIVWGVLNALYFLPLLLSNRNRLNLDIVAQNSKLPSFKEVTSILLTFSLTTFAWIYFRSESVVDANHYIAAIFDTGIFTKPRSLGAERALISFGSIFILILAEWLGRRREYPLQDFELHTKPFLRHLTYYAIVLVIFFFSGEQQGFIYFQF